MKKVLNIAWKDLLVAFRDPAALTLLLLTPFALTLTIGFAFGGLGSGGGNSGLSGIPVVLVNHDAGDFGAYLVEAFESEQLSDLVAPMRLGDDTAARATVDADETAAVIIIPEDFSEGIMSTAERQESVIEVYANPTRPISVGVVRAIVSGFLNQMAGGLAGAEVSIRQLVENGLISFQQAPSLAREIGERAAREAADSRLIAIKSEMSDGGESDNGDFNWATYMAPSMAILFLMFTVTAGGRSILAERDGGTLPRLLVSPTSAAQVLGGKMLGTYFTGVAQVTILVVASSLLFGMRWGAPGLLALLILTLALAATSWGALMAAYARTPSQVNAIGTVLTLTFGVLSGNFMPRQLLPGWLRTLSYVAPNAWGLEAFDILTRGGTLADLVVPLVALLVMSAVLFGASMMGFRRQYK